MSAAVVVAILVAAGEAQSPATIALRAATAEALSSGSSVVVQEAAVFSDGDALKMEDQLRAVAVVEVRWSRATKASANIRMHVARADRWIDREISFLPADAMPERGRTIGFAIASMLISEAEVQAAPVSPGAESAQAAPKLAAESAVPSMAVVAEKAAPVSATASDARTEREAELDARAVDVSAATARAVDVSAVGAWGLNGPARGLGAAARFESAIATAWWWRLGVGVRSGAVPGLNGNDTVFSAAVGVAWRPLVATAASPFGGGLRFDAGILYHDLSHAAPTGDSTHQGRLIPGVVLAAEAVWRASGSVDAVASLGTEVGIGTTDVLVAGHVVATVPVFRGLVELGARIHF